MTPADADSTQVLFIVFFVLGDEDESYDEPDTDLASHPPPP